MSDILQELIVDGNIYCDKTDDSYRIIKYETKWGDLYKIQICHTPRLAINCLEYWLEISDIHITLENAVEAARDRLFMHVNSICSKALMIDGQFKSTVKIADEQH